VIFLNDFENRDMIRRGMIVNMGDTPAKDKIELMMQAYKLSNSL
jgi:uncharacterized protein YneF (UPF0154 family)